MIKLSFRKWKLKRLADQARKDIGKANSVGEVVVPFNGFLKEALALKCLTCGYSKLYNLETFQDGDGI